MSQTQEFVIGQVFNGDYPPEAAEWCNENNAVINQTETGYVIATIPPPTAEELRTALLAQAETLRTYFSTQTEAINGITLPKKWEHIHEWLAFASFKAEGVFPAQAVLIDSLGHNMNAFSVDMIKGTMFQLMQRIMTMNADHASLLQRIEDAGDSVESLQAITITIPEGA